MLTGTEVDGQGFGIVRTYGRLGLVREVNAERTAYSSDMTGRAIRHLRSL